MSRLHVSLFLLNICREDTYVEMINQQLSQPVQYQNVAPSNSHERDQVKSQEMSGVYETIL